MGFLTIGSGLWRVSRAHLSSRLRTAYAECNIHFLYYSSAFKLSNRNLIPKLRPLEPPKRGTFGAARKFHSTRDCGKKSDPWRQKRTFVHTSSKYLFVFERSARIFVKILWYSWAMNKKLNYENIVLNWMFLQPYQ